MNEPLPKDSALNDSAESPAAEISDEETIKLPTPSATESLINALIDAGPEVAEHVVKAAQELILAVQTVIDAADQSIRERQDLREDSDTGSDKSGDTVRHLDIAE